MRLYRLQQGSGFCFQQVELPLLSWRLARWLLLMPKVYFPAKFIYACVPAQSLSLESRTP
jgi:hypothetical protein